jgi:hypothetical protein
MIVSDNSDWDVISDGSESDIYWPGSDVDDDSASLLVTANGNMDKSQTTPDQKMEDVNSVGRDVSGAVGLDEHEHERAQEARTSDDDEYYDDDAETHVGGDDDEIFVSASSPPRETPEAANRQNIPREAPRQQLTPSVPNVFPPGPQLPQAAIGTLSAMLCTIRLLFDSLGNPNAKTMVKGCMIEQLRRLQRLRRDPTAPYLLVDTIDQTISAIQIGLHMPVDVPPTPRVGPVGSDLPAWRRTMGSENVIRHPRAPSFAFDEEEDVNVGPPFFYTPRRRGAISLESPLPVRRFPTYPMPSVPPMAPEPVRPSQRFRTDSPPAAVQGTDVCWCASRCNQIRPHPHLLHYWAPRATEKRKAERSTMDSTKGTWEQVKTFMEENYESPLYQRPKIRRTRA